MRLRWASIAAFAAGLVVGVGGAYFALARQVLWMDNRFLDLQVTEMAVDGQELSMGRADRLAERIAMALPVFATRLGARLPDPEAAITLWSVRQYYERTGRTAPPELSSILAGLPVEYAPLCRKPEASPQPTPQI